MDSRVRGNDGAYGNPVHRQCSQRSRLNQVGAGYKPALPDEEIPTRKTAMNATFLGVFHAIMDRNLGDIQVTLSLCASGPAALAQAGSGAGEGCAGDVSVFSTRTGCSAWRANGQK